MKLSSFLSTRYGLSKSLADESTEREMSSQLMRLIGRKKGKRERWDKGNVNQRDKSHDAIYKERYLAERVSKRKIKVRK